MNVQYQQHFRGLGGFCCDGLKKQQLLMLAAGFLDDLFSAELAQHNHGERKSNLYGELCTNVFHHYHVYQLLTLMGGRNLKVKC